MDLPGAVYTITEVLKEGWHQSYPDGELKGHVVSLDSGHKIESLDFGNYSLWIYMPVIYSEG